MGKKTEVMVCHPGEIRSFRSVDGYRQQLTGVGETYKERKRRRTSCPICDKNLSLASLPAHLRSKHGIHSTFSIVDDGPLPAPVGYKLSFPLKTNGFRAPFPVALMWQPIALLYDATSFICIPAPTFLLRRTEPIASAI